MATTSSATGHDQESIDPYEVIPLEAARATLMHWWREPVAGLFSIGIGVWDTWHYGRDDGLSSSIDESLVIGGIVLIAGSRKLFTGSNGTNGTNGKTVNGARDQTDARDQPDKGQTK